MFGDISDKERTAKASQLKQQLLDQAMAPALEKQERLVALQHVLPGTPVTYYADLYGQTGGELDNNRFQQSRTPFHTDWLNEKQQPEKTQARQFHQAILPYIQLRNRFPALKNGLMLKTLPDSLEDRQKLDESGIVPVLRDNGTQQVLALVNTGRPSATGNPNNPIDYWNLTRSPEGVSPPAYPLIKAQQPVAYNVVTDLSSAQIPVGTKYRTVPLKNQQPIQAYVVALTPNGRRLLVKDIPTLYNRKGQPVLKTETQAETQHLGMDIGIMTFLERV